jgi:hypothetical protein
MKTASQERYTDRTCAIIKRGGRILIKAEDGWYVGGWSNIAGGEDYILWTSRPHAQEFGDLTVAFAVSKIFTRKKVKVVTVYRR